jgi:hypothetical protein
VPHYTFISSISAYARMAEPGLDEEAPLEELTEAGSEDLGRHYGPLKVLCEREVHAVYPAGALIIRPGLIVGPHDPTDRFTYWPVRIAEGGEVLAPGDPDRPVQVIDVRDLAAWNLDLAERGVTGVFNATGPAMTLTMGAMLERCREATGSDATFTWVSEEFLLERKVAPWSELPSGCRGRTRTRAGCWRRTCRAGGGADVPAAGGDGATRSRGTGAGRVSRVARGHGAGEGARAAGRVAVSALSDAHAGAIAPRRILHAVRLVHRYTSFRSSARRPPGLRNGWWVMADRFPAEPADRFTTTSDGVRIAYAVVGDDHVRVRW